MVQFAAVVLRGVIAMFVGLLIAGGTFTLAADRAPVERPTLVPVSPPGTATLDVPDVTGQAYVFAKGILQDHGFAWHVTGPVMGYAANTVATQSPSPGTTVVDNGAPMITLTLARNPSYVERGSPENDAPYPATSIEIPAGGKARPVTTVKPQLEPVQPSGLTAPTTPVETPLAIPTPTPVVTTPSPATTPVVTPPASVPVPAQVTKPVTPVVSPKVAVPSPASQPVTPAAPVTSTPAPAVSSTRRTPDFTVAGAPKEPVRSISLPDRVAALARWIESHRDPSAANLNHWLYEHAYVVAGARFGWWHGAAALQALILVDKRAEASWGVGSQSRTTAQKALAEVRSRAS